MTYALRVHSPAPPRIQRDGNVTRAGRPGGLAGLRVALIWNAKAGGEERLGAVGAALAEHGVTTTVYHGAYPSPQPLLAQVAAENDAAIVGIGDCGASAAWSASDVRFLETSGRPAGAVVSTQYADDARAVAYAAGLDFDPFVQLDESDGGASGVVPRLVAALTGAPEPLRSLFERGRDDTLTFTAEDPLAAVAAMNEGFLERRWGDGFPVVPPTAEAVEAMLRHGGWDADAEVCAVPPGGGVATVGALAVNAVMAGCLPEHLPIVIAGVRAIAAMGDQAVRIGVSASPLSWLLVVNGPLAREVGVNNGRCALGPGLESRANVVLGRALSLAAMNLGLCFPGQLDCDSIGSPRKFSMCLAEREDDGWEPLHAERGFARDASTATVFCVWSESTPVDVFTSGGEDALRSIAYMETRPGGWHLVHAFGGVERSEHGLLILITPEHARTLRSEGWDKPQVKQFVWWHARASAAELMHRWEPIKSRLRPQWRWLGELGRDEREAVMLQTQELPDRLEVLIVGSGAPYDGVFGTFGDAVTVEIPSPGGLLETPSAR